MLYESYRRKIEQIAEVFRVIWRLRFVIIGILTLACLSTGGFLAVKGNVTDEIECPETVVYGEALGYEASGLFSDIAYQYSTDPSFTTYSDEMPRLPGTYYVRAVSNGSFNSVKYGNVYSFKVVKKAIDVTIKESTWTYGDSPSVTANLAYDDAIFCSSFDYTNLGSAEATVTPAQSGIKITDAKGNDVTEAYEITPVDKTTPLQKRDITITVGSAEKEYDSIPLQFTGYEVTGGNLVKLNENNPDSILATYSSSITDVGETSNVAVTLHIRTSGGVDVTHLYNITVVEGKLTVNKRPVIFNIDSSEITYDGEAHPDIDYEIDESTPLIDGHTEEFIPVIPDGATAIIHAGKYQVNQYVDFRISYVDEEENIVVDVTDNYFIFLPEDSYVEILKREITVTTPSGEWTYDALPHSNGEFTISESTDDSGLVDGHTYTFSTAVSVTNASSVSNAVTLTIKDENGKNVSKNYAITYALGTLTVNKRPISITTDSASWVYDGAPHHKNTWQYTDPDVSDDNKLVSGHTSLSNNAPNVTNFNGDGEENRFDITIKDANGNFVTSNYEITYAYGTLVIEKRDVYIVTGTDSLIYNGSAQYVHNWTYKTFDADDTTPNYQLVESHRSDVNNGYSTFTNVTDPDDDNLNVFAISIINSADIDVSDNYNIHYEYGTVEILPRPVYVVTDSARIVYDAQSHSVDTWGYKFFETGDATAHFELVESHLYEVIGCPSFTNVNETFDGNNVFTLKITDADGNEVTDNYTIYYEYGTVEIAERSIYIVTDGDRFVYDAAPHSVGSWQYKVFDEEDTTERFTIVDSHIWEIVNLLSFTYVNETLDGNNVFDLIIKDADGNVVTENYAIYFEYGTVEIAERSIYIVTDSNSFVYDDVPHSAGSWQYKVFDEEDTTERFTIVDSHIWEIVNLLSFTYVNETLDGNNVFDLIIKDADGNDVTENYAIYFEYGTVEITQRVIHIVTDSGEWVYDGEEHSSPTFSYQDVEDGVVTFELVAGHLYEAIDAPIVSLVSDGTVDNIFTIIIRDAYGNDVTENYLINYSYGTIKVTKREIHISTPTIERVYDGYTYEFTEWTYTDGSPYEIVFNNNVQQYDELVKFITVTDVTNGPIQNELILAILDEYGNDVTDNYDIHYTYGTITINKRSIHIVTDSDEFTYDGEKHSVPTVSYRDVEDGVVTYLLADGHYYEAVGVPYVSLVSDDTVENRFAIIIRDANGKNVTSNYDIDYTYGTIKVVKRPIHILTDSGEFVYDAKDHSVPTFSYVNVADGVVTFKLVNGHTYEAVGAPSISIVTDDAVKNEFDIIIKDAKGNDVTANYDINYSYGTIKVVKRPIYITTDSEQFVYDAKPHHTPTFSYTTPLAGLTNYKLVAGHTYEAVNAPSVSTVAEGAVDNIFTIIIRGADGNDVTENYDIHYTYGTIQVIKREIHVTTPSVEFVYDGDVHTFKDWFYSSDTPYQILSNEVSQQYAIVATFTSVKDHTDKPIKNAMTLKILDENDTDVTENYDIVFDYGTINVLKREIHISTPNVEFVYDGEVHIFNEWNYANASPYKVVSHERAVMTGTSRKDATNSPLLNKPVSFVIFNKDNEDVTANYDIVFDYGTITILKRVIHISTPTVNIDYDGKVHDFKDWYYKDDSPYQLVNNGSIKHKEIITRYVSEKNYTPNPITNRLNITVVDENGNDVTKNYSIKYDYGTITINRRTIHILTDSGEFVYDGKDHSLTTISFRDVEAGVVYELAEGHFYTAVGAPSVSTIADDTVENKFDIIIKDDKGVDVTGNYEIAYAYGTIKVVKRPIHILTDSGEWVYDGKEHSSPTFSYQDVEDGVVTYKLIAGHTYTAVGAPSVSTVNDNTVENKFTIIIKDAKGNDVTENYDINCSYGTIKVTPRPIHILTDSGEFVYDAEAHSLPTFSYQDVEDGVVTYKLIAGHTYTAVGAPSVSTVKDGTVENKFKIIIMDAKGNDVTANYSINNKSGTIKVIPRTVHITTDSGEFVYDTLKHSLPTFDYTNVESGVVTFKFVEGHTCEVIGAPSVSTVTEGSVENKFTIIIKDDKGNDVTANYNIVPIYGTIKIVPRAIHILTGSGEFTYDGKAHSVPTVDYREVTDGDTTFKLIEGHVFEVINVPSVSTVTEGIVKNKFAVLIKDADGNDVTENYSINYKYGTIKVNPRPIHILTDSGEWVYDGEKHSVPTFSYQDVADGVTTYKLIAGHTYEAVGVPSISIVTDDAVKNEFAIIIKDADGNDVTVNYSINYAYGTIAVTPRTVYITTDSGKFVYDGEKHSVPTFSYRDVDNVNGFELVSGHTYQVVGAPSVSTVTEDPVENRFTIVIKDAKNRDVTANYDVKYLYGTLEVTHRPIYILTDSGEWVYDGKEHSSPTFSYQDVEDGVVTYKLIAGHTYEAVGVPSVSTVNDNTVENKFTIIIKDAKGNDVTANYDINYSYGTIKVVKRPIHILTDSGEWVYDGKEHFVSTFSYAKVESGVVTYKLIAGHTYEAVRVPSVSTVNDNTVENKFTIIIKDAEGNDVTANYDINYSYGTIKVNPRPIYITTDSGQFVYDAKPHSVPTFTYSTVLSGTTKYELLEGHTYEAVGAPSVSTVTEGTVENKFTIIIKDAKGNDVTANYNIVPIYGTIKVTPRSMYILTDSGEWIYDGDVHSVPTFTYRELSSSVANYELVDGHTYEAIGAPSVSAVAQGTVENKFTIIIKDAAGNNVTENYSVNYRYGKIKVLPRPIHLTTGSGEWVYDGEKHSVLTVDYRDVAEGVVTYKIVDGHKIEISGSVPSVSAVADGIVENKFAVIIKDAEGKKVTSNYSIDFVYGTLEVTPRPIFIITDSGEWVYDGLTHSVTTFTYLDVANGIPDYKLVSGHTYQAVGAPSVSTVADGTVENRFAIIIKDAKGKDVTANYDVDYTYGTIKVLPRTIYILTDSSEFIYDGAAHSVPTFSYRELAEGIVTYKLVIGHTYTAVGAPSVSTVAEGTVENRFAIIIKDARGNDVTANYSINYSYGTIKVTPRPIYITTDSGAFVYDGEKHSVPTVSYREVASGVTALKLVTGHTYEAVGAPTVSTVAEGTVENRFAIIIKDAEGKDVTANYDVDYTYGTIKVTPRTIHVLTGSGEFVYDGNAHSVPTVSYRDVANGVVTFELVAGHTYEAVNAPSVSTVAEGTVENRFAIIIKDAEGKDVTANYSIDYRYGTISILRREIHISTPTVELVYDGKVHDFKDWYYTDGSPYQIIYNDGVKQYASITEFVSLKDHTPAPVTNKLVLAILDADGEDVTANYDIHYNYGTISILRREIHISTPTVELVYDGLTHKFLDWSYGVNSPYQIVSSGEVKHKISIVDFVTRRSYTEIALINEVVLAVLDENGDDVTANYDIKYDYGTITIKQRPISILTGSKETVYDDNFHSNGSWEYVGAIDNMTRFEIVSTHNWVAVDVPEFKYVTTETGNNVFTIQIFDGEEDVSYNYDITYSYGTIKINKRVIYISTATDSWIYDDELHWNTDWTYHDDTPYEILGAEPNEKVHTFEVVFFPTVRYVSDGVKNNELILVVLDEDEKDVTWNYDFQTKEMGTISITPREIIITTATNKWEYDGEEHYDIGYTLSDLTPVVTGHTISVVGYTTIKDIGEKDNELSFVIKSGDTDVSSNYNIVQIKGTLKITDRYIEIAPNSISKEYDRTPLLPDGFEIVFGTLKGGDRIVIDEVVLIGSQTEIGQSAVTILEGSVRIVDEDGNDVTSTYTIELIPGTLTVTKIKLTVTAGSASKPYDGTPLTSGEFLYSGKLLADHTVYAETLGSQTEVGISANVIVPDSVKVYDQDGNDVTDIYYEIIPVEGTLEVTHCATIKVTTGSATKEYDGTPLTSDVADYEILSGAFFPGDYIVIKVIGTQTTVGSSQNTVEVDVLNANGESVLHRYKIEYDLGTLEVTKRKVTLQTGSDWKIYDGAPLTCEENILLNLLKGHNHTVTVNGSQTEVGKSENTVLEGSLKIFDEQGNDVTDLLYEVTYDLGWLVVSDGSDPDNPDNPDDPDGSGGSGGSGGSAPNLDDSGEINGGEFQGGQDKEPGPPVVVLKIKSTTSGTVYLRLTSFGDYTGKGWEAATEYEKYVMENYGFNYLVALALKLAGVGEEQRLDVQSFTGDYLLPYFLSTTDGEYVVQDSDVRFDGTHNGTYSVYYYTYNGNFSDLNVDLGALSEVEELYREFVHNQYTAIDTETDAFIQKIIREQGWSKDDPNIIIKVQRYVQNCANYSLSYDRNLDKEDNIVVAFLGDEYNEGICQHYASAATMIFRALDIPARYTIGYVGSTVANEWTDVTTQTAHAWTEVYIDGIGWIPVEVTGAGAGEGGNVGGGDSPDEPDFDWEELPTRIEITPVEVSKKYDGTPLYAINQLDIPLNSPLEQLLEMGFYYEVVVSGSAIERGVSKSYIESFKLYDPDGVDVTDRFEIIFNTGNIRITGEQVVIVLYDIEKEFDGKPISYNPGDYWIRVIPEGYTLEFSLEGSITQVGEFDVELLYSLPFKVFNELGEDVTESFDLLIEGDGISVKQRTLELLAASATRHYNGQALTDNTVSIILGSLIEGHRMVCTTSGSITDVGTTDNEISSCIIYDQHGNDVTNNYDITKIPGVLTILKGSNV